MKKTLLILFLAITCFSSFAQYRGFNGKRLMVKTSIMDGKNIPCRNIEMEFALTRVFSVSFGYQFFESYNMGQRVDKDNYDNTYSNIFADRAYVKSNTFYYGLKLYVNKTIPAPRGFYFYWQNGFGKGTFSGLSIIEDEYYGTPDIYSFIHKKVPIMTYSFGLGKQVFLTKRLSLDFSLGFAGAAHIGRGNYSSKSIDEIGNIMPYYGPSLVSFTSLRKIPSPTSIYSSSANSSDLKPKSGSFGLDFRIKFGILLF